MKRLILLPLAATIVLTMLVTGLYAATVDIAARDFLFEPAAVTINVGDTVRWTNQGAAPHTSTSGTNCAPSGTWDSGLLQPGETFELVFEQPGEFPYFCTPHCAQGMTGSITVQQGSTSALRISPPTGTYLSTQNFDLALITSGITEIPSLTTITLNGQDISAQLAACSIPGTLTNGGTTIRCPEIGRAHV